MLTRPDFALAERFEIRSIINDLLARDIIKELIAHELIRKKDDLLRGSEAIEKQKYSFPVIENHLARLSDKIFLHY